MPSRAESCLPDRSIKAATAIVSRPAIKDATIIKPNVALLGATQAFSARSTPSRTNAGAPSPTRGATIAAAAARTNSSTRLTTAPPGKPRDARSTGPQTIQRPQPTKSHSQLAAQAASASTSPQKKAISEKSYNDRTATQAARYTSRLLPPAPQKVEADVSPDRGRSRENSSYSTEPLAGQSALTAVLNREQSASPGSTIQSLPAQPAKSELSAGLSAARAAVHHAGSVEQLPDPLPSPNDRFMQGKSVGSPSYEHPPSTEAGSAASSSWNVQVQIERLKSVEQNHDNQSVTSSNLSTVASSRAMSHNGPDQMQSSTSPNSQPKDMSAGMADWAWSAASSRASSPVKVAQPPANRKRSQSHSLFHHHQPSQRQEVSKPVPPAHVLKHTLRKHKSDDEDEENGNAKRGRRHFIRKHQHKHHEGDRKRWRDRVTERERKRYEGVWAANKGLYTFSRPPDGTMADPSQTNAEKDSVLNIVVRDIWERSRLPKDILEEVWGLVAREDVATLRRDEFVVGLWLIDQRLKGRKLPSRVSLSVWQSARHTVKIRHE